MSARAPFIPKGADSRASQLNDKNSNPNNMASNTTFPVNPRSNLTASNITAPQISSTNNKPLNLSSLKRSSNSGNAEGHSMLGARKSIEPIVRPGTAVPALRSNDTTQNTDGTMQMKIAAPTPRSFARPSPPLLAGSGSFPESGSLATIPLQLVPLQEPPVVITHGIFSTNPDTNNRVQDATLVTRSRSLQRTDNKGAGHVDNLAGFGLHTPLANQGGPRRVLFAPSHEPNYRGILQSDFNPPQTNAPGLSTTLSGPNEDSMNHIARNVRRSREEFEEDCQDEVYDNEIKRQKTQNDQDRHMTGFDHLDQRSSPQPHYIHHGTLNTLFGRDVDAYIEGYMDRYTEARTRWKECTTEEWMAGADELASKFAKILDFVKDHMMTKIKLFADMNARIDDHGEILNACQSMLDRTKQRLVQDSGAVLGR